MCFFGVGQEFDVWLPAAYDGPGLLFEGGWARKDAGTGWAAGAESGVGRHWRWVMAVAPGGRGAVVVGTYSV